MKKQKMQEYVVTVWDNKRKTHWHIEHILAYSVTDMINRAYARFGELLNTF